MVLQEKIIVLLHPEKLFYKNKTLLSNTKYILIKCKKYDFHSKT